MSGDADPLLGRVLDRRLRIDRRVGAGGHGVVYAGWHLELAAPVAIKLVALPDDMDLERRAERVQRLLEEGRILVRFRHPGIARALDLGTVQIRGVATPYLVMEWCEGESLSSILKARRGAPMSIDEALAIVDPLADALSHAHAAGVAHRDLKPSNVMMSGAAPRLIDFGIAKLVDSASLPGSGHTRTDSPRSPFTPAYAAPEQVIGARTGPWTDVHALGLLFTELVTGKPPYGERGLPTMAAVAPGRPTPGSLGVDVRALEPVIARALSLQPSERYPDAGTLREALRRARAEQRSPVVAPDHLRPASFPALAVIGASTSTQDRTAPPSSQRVPAAAPRTRRRGRWAAVLGISVVAIVAVATVISTGRSPLDLLPAGTKAVSTCALTDQEVSARASRAGWTVSYRGVGPGSRTYTLERPEGVTSRWLTWQIDDLTDQPGPASPRTYLFDMLQGRGESTGTAYGLKTNCVVTVMGMKDAAIARAFDDLTRGMTWDVAGNTISGPDPVRAKGAAALTLTTAPLVARRLAELSRPELETRVARLGWKTNLVSRDATWVTISITRGKDVKTITWIALSESTTAADFRRPLYRGAAYAIDGRVAVWGVAGPNSESRAFLEEVLTGLGARVLVVP